MDDSAPPNARALIGSLAELGHPQGDQLDVLLADIEWMRVAAGRRLFSEGEPADGMYLLFEGRVRFLVEDHTGAHVTWELDAVGVFGEGALLTGGGRSRTAVVVRDALLARLPPVRFEELASSAPGVALAIARRVAHRTVFPNSSALAAAPRSERIAVVSPTLPAARLQPIANAIAGGRAATLEDTIDIAGREEAATLPTVIRHSDRVLLAVESTQPTDLTPVVHEVRHGIDPLAAPTVELVLIHPAHTGLPVGTPSWLAGHSFAAHHHVRQGTPADLARLGRRVAGSAVGLVLSGGGARGLAHIGVMRALDELGVPIDSVGGSSMGAIVGGQVAFEWPWERMLAENETAWRDRRLRLDITVPTVSLFSGRRTRRIFDQIFAGADIADAPIPFFCTSVDLSAFRLAIHRAGSAATWVRASASAPGLWPPVVDGDGHLHIDGGQLNHVPTDVMREQHAGPIIAVDVFATQAAMTLAPGTEPPVGLRHLFRRRSRGRYPGFTDIMNRCALLGSLQHQEGARRYADLYITPDLSALSFGAFDRIGEMCAIGYRAAMEVLQGPDGQRLVERARAHT